MSDAALSNPFASSVLVLNRAYLAIHVVNLKRALSLLCRNLAEVVDIEDGQYFNYDFNSWLELSQMRSSLKNPLDDWIRTVRFEVQAPRVIRLFGFDRVPRQTVKFNRRNVFARDRNQ
ncbi:MAG TPA: HNH endonuclease, partial [Pirellulales bacterium]